MYKINENIQTDLPSEAIEELEKIFNGDPDSIRIIKSSLTKALIHLILSGIADQNIEHKLMLEDLAIAYEQLFKLLNCLDDFNSVFERAILNKEKRKIILDKLQEYELVEV